MFSTPPPDLFGRCYCGQGLLGVPQWGAGVQPQGGQIG
jgi:hypothetical protein